MKVLITGVAGQDGSWLAELLVDRGHDVHGVMRAGESLVNLDAVKGRVALHDTDLGDASAVASLVDGLRPDRCFHLAAQSFVHGADAAAMLAANTATTVHLLEALATRSPATRLFFAGSAEQLAGNDHSPQREDSADLPRTVYGLSKSLAASAVRFYRRERGLFAVVGLLYNHESTRRGPLFLSMKLARAAARIAAGLDDHVDVGDLGAVRDWGYAPEYVDGFARALDVDDPADIVFATGVGRTVGEFAEAAFAAVGLDAAAHVRVDPALVRPREPVVLVGDPRRAEARLGWRARKPFDEMVAELVEHERGLLRRSRDATTDGR
jgi:GDPmannose 4,6-dehydratase